MGSVAPTVSLFAVFQCLAQSSRAKCSRLTGREAQWPWNYSAATREKLLEIMGASFCFHNIYIYTHTVL